MEHLIKEEILAPLNFSDLGHCIECIKGKYVKHIKKTEATRSSGVIEIIHSDICGPFNVKYIDGFNSFITFTDDFSHYGYIYPIRERSEALDNFKIFKSEVENQHNVKIKVMCSDRCHTRFLCQNQVLIVCMTHDQLFHTYGQKCSQITKCHE
jgi:hypothetical protein